jgi:predicted O-methyltransferase YrrM
MKPASLAITTIKSDSLDQAFAGIEKGSNPQDAPPLTDWNMARDDGPILGRIIRWVTPRRHLEFGTWKGFGACLVMENSPATVWTINLWEGELHPEGGAAYSESLPLKRKRGFLEKLWGKNFAADPAAIQTDAKDKIGIMIHKKNLGHRVNHVFCDSKKWDTSAYPNGFFDTIFVDGGHQADVVASDTRKALPLLREGGVILWHDFCLDEAVRKKFKHVNTVIAGVEAVAEEIKKQGISLYWINPSWLLCGIKGNVPIPTAKS